MSMTARLGLLRKSNLILNKFVIGTASALNAGIRLSEREYIAWLSSDDYFLPDKLEKQLEWMIKNKLKICFSSFYQMNEKSEIMSKWSGR